MGDENHPRKLGFIPIPKSEWLVRLVRQKGPRLGIWSSGMIRPSGGRGRGFDSPNPPFFRRGDAGATSTRPAHLLEPLVTRRRREGARVERSCGVSFFFFVFFSAWKKLSPEQGTDEKSLSTFEPFRRRVASPAWRARRCARRRSFPRGAKGGLRESNPRPPRPKRGIIPLDQVPKSPFSRGRRSYQAGEPGSDRFVSR